MNNSSKRFEHFINQVLTGETENSQEARQKAFIARALLMAIFSRNKPYDGYFEKKNSPYTSSVTADPVWNAIWDYYEDTISLDDY